MKYLPGVVSYLNNILRLYRLLCRIFIHKLSLLNWICLLLLRLSRALRIFDFFDLHVNRLLYVKQSLPDELSNLNAVKCFLAASSEGRQALLMEILKHLAYLFLWLHQLNEIGALNDFNISWEDL